MNKLQKALCIWAGILSLAGCVKYKTGEVIKEYGADSNRLIPSQISGFFISGGTVKIGNSYVLEIKTDDGIYTASVLPNSPITLEALSLALKEGDKINFAVTSKYSHAGFNKNKIGTIYANEIKILSSKE